MPLDIAASGPKVIDFSARTAERITFALGADPERVAWGIELARAAAADAGRDPADLTFGSYVSIGCHPDIDAARAMVHGSVAAFAHFSSMPGSTGAGLAGRGPGHRRRGRPQLRQQPAPPQRRHAHRCAHRRVHRPVRRHRPARSGRSNGSQELAALGIDRFVVTGPGFGADRDDGPHSPPSSSRPKSSPPSPDPDDDAMANRATGAPIAHRYAPTRR